MPKLMSNDDTQVINIEGTGGFQFSAIRPEKLESTEYTLVTIVVDVTGSVINFANELLECVKNIINSCKKSPKSENLMIRFISFNDEVEEIHGFKLLESVNVNEYKSFRPWGMTALYDASYSSIAATLTYAKNLIDQDFDVNGCVYIITDGLDNRSKMSTTSIYKKINDAILNEEIESLTTILIGLNNPGDLANQKVIDSLKIFKEEAGLTQFVDIGDATDTKLAKLANFISQSITSQSQSLGSGSTGSQSLTF